MMIFQIILMILPWSVRRRILCRFYGYRIDPTARIGFSLIFAKRLEMAAGSSIGHLSFAKGLDLLELGMHASLGNLNWITGFPSGTDSPHFADQPNRKVCLRLGEHGAITHRHLLDCTGGITIGRYSTLAGFRTQVLTHSINVREARQRAAPVDIGEFCFVGTGSILLGGAVLPAYSVLGAGAVLNKSYDGTHALYAGCPAKPVTALDHDLAYFTRAKGFVI